MIMIMNDDSEDDISVSQKRRRRSLSGDEDVEDNHHEAADPRTSHHRPIQTPQLPQPNEDTRRRRRRRRRQATAAIDASETAPAAATVWWRDSFPHQSHSLKINVSELAACAGFHPFKCLPKLCYHHVYQGKPGQLLLQHDAKLLGLGEVVSEEEIWKALAQKAGPSTQKALTQALQVSTGQHKVASIQHAEALRAKWVQETQATTRLSAHEKQVLQEGLRQSIHTGVGTDWEDEALDWYQETHCCPAMGDMVQHRNQEIRVWDFDVTAKPLGPARKSDRRISTHPKGENDEDETSAEKVTEVILPATTAMEMDGEKATNTEEDIPVVDLTDDAMIATATTAATDTDHREHPYFSLRGAVDGIRDELVVGKNSSSSSSDEWWTFQNVIIECKHRMYKLQPTPPLYEMIQATAYCLMYQTHVADILQVLRIDNDPPRKSKSTIHKSSSEQKENEPVLNKITEYLTKPSAAKLDAPKEPSDDLDENDAVKKKSSSVDETTKPEADDDTKPVSQPHKNSPTTTTKAKPKPKSSAATMKMSVHRIDIEDPTYRHGQNWHEIVAPRLQSWTQGVYQVRSQEGLRYRLVTAMASDNLQEAWNILLEQCPWLKDCDTSYHRDIQMMNSVSSNSVTT